MVPPFWKIVQQFFEKLGIKLSYKPVIPHLVFTQMKTCPHKDFHENIHSTINHLSSKLEMSINW